VTATNRCPPTPALHSEVARSLGLSPRFVKSLVQGGGLPSLKVGRLRDLEAWVSRQRGSYPLIPVIGAR
jgi:excisionase family DNA binding protein